MSSLKLSSSIFPFSSPSHAFSKPIFRFLQFKPITFQPIPTTTTTTTTANTKPHKSPSIASSLKPNHHDIDHNNLPPKLQEIIKLFQSVPDPRAKYQQLLFYGNTLPPLDERYKTQENKVQGCVSQVWLRAYLGHDHDHGDGENGQQKVVYFEADSDSSMTKGLAALLVISFSGLPIADILRVSPEFVTLLGLQQSLTESRNNGFLNMFRLMQSKALYLGLEAEKKEAEQSSGDEVVVESSNLDVGNQVIESNGVGSSSLDVGSADLKFDNQMIESNGVQSFQLGVDNQGIESNGVGNLSLDSSNEGNGSDSSGFLGARGQRIREVLERELKPVELQIEDISYQHAGHVGVRGTNGGETHFNLKIVSPEFEGKSLVRRHRMIYQLLQPELDSGLHALSITAKTPQELEYDK